MIESSIRAALNEKRDRHHWRSRAVRFSPVMPSLCIEGQTYLSFASNDYLGMANHPAVVQAFKRGLDQYGAGSGASVMLGGYSAAHRALEEAMADFLGYPRCLVFSSGYLANLGALSALSPHLRAVISDKLVHASLIDACAGLRCEHLRYRHNDLGHLEKRLVPHSLIMAEGLYSMTGDTAPIAELIALKSASQSMLLIDDVHGIAVMGETGRGVCESYTASVDLISGGFGKAFGTAGGVLLGSELLIEACLQFSRSYIYTTAMPAALAVATRESLRVIQEESWRRKYLHELINYFHCCAKQTHYDCAYQHGPIQALYLYDEVVTLKTVERLKSQGIWVAGIRPPTVPKGKSMLRISLTVNHTKAAIDALFSALS